MLNKIVVRNVGVLRAFDTPNAPKLDRLTLFYGRNGRGKSTLTAVLRAARDGDAATILGRMSLGNGGAAPKVVLTSVKGNVVFDKGAWNTKGAPIEVFDTTFIADNVYAGELIDLSHDRGLFSVIIGADGVRLANQLERFNTHAKLAGTALKAAEGALADDIPTGMNKEEFFALGPNADYQNQLEAAERSLKAVQQQHKIAALKTLKTLVMPEIPINLAAILSSTVANIDASARRRLLDHYKRFGFDRKGEAWIRYGVEHIHDEACPFCGRDSVNAAGMVSLYGQIFSETYKSHLEAITASIVELESRLGDDARVRIIDQAAENAEMLKKWTEFVAIRRNLPNISEITENIKYAHKNSKELIDRKRSSPLDVIEATNEIASVTKTIDDVRRIISEYNEIVESINQETKEIVEAIPITEASAIIVRNNVKKRIARNDQGVQDRVDNYLAVKRRDLRARNMRTIVQKRLKSANEGAAEHYHDRVNCYLGRFGASFKISKISNSMQGNAGQADYALLIKGEKIARGRGRQSETLPTFRNTLSAGDKTTLALAFFLSKLDSDPRLASKTLVIDDPLSSHDSHRRRETVNAIQNLCARSLQVIVLSHDEYLLREVKNRCVDVKCTAFQIEFSDKGEWSSAFIADLDQICRTEHVRLVDEIISFVDERQGDANHIVLNLRRVLETHYRRSYRAYFKSDQNLGQIVQEIASAGPSHPCHADLQRIENCNDATRDKHHGDHAIVALKQGVDPDELRVIACDALKLIGARPSQ